MPYIETGWLCLALGVVMLLQIATSHFFYRKYLETIEDALSDIALVKKHRDFYGDSHFGRRMREILLALLLIVPGAFWRQESIPRWKLKKLSPLLRFGVTFFHYSMWVIGLAMVLLWYLRLRHGS